MKIPISNIPSLKNSLPYLKKVINSRWISSNGKMVSKFEKDFSTKDFDKILKNLLTFLFFSLEALK